MSYSVLKCLTVSYNVLQCLTMTYNALHSLTVFLKCLTLSSTASIWGGWNGRAEMIQCLLRSLRGPCWEISIGGRRLGEADWKQNQGRNNGILEMGVCTVFFRRTFPKILSLKVANSSNLAVINLEIHEKIKKGAHHKKQQPFVFVLCDYSLKWLERDKIIVALADLDSVKTLQYTVWQYAPHQSMPKWSSPKHAWQIVSHNTIFSKTCLRIWSTRKHCLAIWSSPKHAKMIHSMALPHHTLWVTIWLPQKHCLTIWSTQKHTLTIWSTPRHVMILAGRLLLWWAYLISVWWCWWV